MDLNLFDTRKSADIAQTLRLLNPVTGEQLVNSDGSFMELDLLGAESQALENKRTELQRRVMTAGKQSLDPKAVSAEVLATATVAVRNIEVDGTAVDVRNPSSVRAMYLRFEWVRQQADDFVTNRANFFKA